MGCVELVWSIRSRPNDISTTSRWPVSPAIVGHGQPLSRGARRARMRARMKNGVQRVSLQMSEREGGGVLVAAFQSEREEKTRDRAERGSAVRGFDQASVAAKQDPIPTDRAAIWNEKRLAATVPAARPRCASRRTSSAKPRQSRASARLRSARLHPKR